METGWFVEQFDHCRQGYEKAIGHKANQIEKQQGDAPERAKERPKSSDDDQRKNVQKNPYDSGEGMIVWQHE